MPDIAGHELDLRSSGSCLVFMRAELAAFGLEPSTDSSLKLEISAGKGVGGETIYRPYKVLGDVLSRVINTTHVNEGSGPAASGKFRSAQLTIDGWFLQQSEIDAALNLTVPSAPSRYPLKRGSVSLKTVTVYD